MDTTLGIDAVETVVVGAGQAGLAVAYQLARHGRNCVVLDGADRVGNQWRQQWDTLRLYSPAKYDGLPGMAFPGDPWGFPTKDQVGDFLEEYARRFELPVRLGVRVQRIGALEAGYLVETNHGVIRCRNVVVATGTFGRTPFVPDLATQLNPAILQLHSSAYRRPGQLHDGAVLVVGASHSGTEIAYELAQSHPTTLVGRDCGQIPIDLGSGQVKAVFPALMFVWRHVLTRRTPMGRREMAAIRAHGGPMLRVKREHLAARGVVRNTSRVVRARDGRPELSDGTLVDAATVIWATGFQQAFDWIDLPVLGADGWPRESRGEALDAPGLYFCGLSFQYAFSSMLIGGVGRDAAYVANRIAARTAHNVPVGATAG